MEGHNCVRSCQDSPSGRRSEADAARGQPALGTGARQLLNDAKGSATLNSEKHRKSAVKLGAAHLRL